MFFNQYLKRYQAFAICKSSRPEMSYKKSILTNFVKFLGKYLCRSLFCNKNIRWSHAVFSKRGHRRRWFPVNFAQF